MKFGSALLPLLLLGVAAAPLSDGVRAALEAHRAGERERAERLYHLAAERASDPGWIAFNLGILAAERGEWREAEVSFRAVLDDRAAARERITAASYNLGVCLLNRGGGVAVYRNAITCFEQALAGNPEERLAVDAQHNLELAKLLWIQARGREQRPPRDEDSPPEAPPPAPQPDTGVPKEEPNSDQPMGGNSNSARPEAGPAPKSGSPVETPHKAPGAGTLPVLLDSDSPQRLSPEDARDHLRRATERAAEERRANARLTLGPERPHVRDW